jgi:hypothetical protein
MQSFNQFTESERRRKLSRQTVAVQSSLGQADGSSATTTSQSMPDTDGLILGIIESLKRVRLIAEDNDQLDIAGTAKDLGDKIIAIHQVIMNDPGAGLQTQRISYQNMCLAFLTVLAIAEAAGRSE